MRTNLKVPFGEKDAAKRLGAKWDAPRKVWYVENVSDISVFAKWLPKPEATGATGPVKSAAAKKLQSAGKTIITGSAFIEQPRVCDCLPWDVCEKCLSSAR